MLKLTKENLTNAIARAKKIRSSVKWLSGRSYQVTGSQGALYTVHLAVARDAQGKQVCLGTCDCEAGKNEMACFHLAAACSLNIAIHAMRQTVKPDEAKTEATPAPVVKATPKHYGRTLEAFQI